jgi:hypothetical protein
MDYIFLKPHLSDGYLKPVLKIISAFSAKFFFAEEFLRGLPQKFEGFFSLFFCYFNTKKFSKKIFSLKKS